MKISSKQFKPPIFDRVHYNDYKYLLKKVEKKKKKLKDWNQVVFSAYLLHIKKTVNLFF